MKQLKLLFTVLFLAVLGLGNVWAAEDPLYACDFTTVTATGYTQNLTFTLPANGKEWKASVAQVASNVFYLGCNSNNAAKGVLYNNSNFSDVYTAVAAADNMVSTTTQEYALLFNNAYNNVGTVEFAWDGGNNAFQVYLFGYKGTAWELLSSTNYASSGTAVAGNVKWTSTTGVNFTKFAIVARPGTATTTASNKTLRAKSFTIEAAGGSTETAVNVDGVSLDQTSLTLVEGATETLVATVSPDNATNKNVTWTSSKESVATVSADGVVTAKAAGTAVISVKTVDGNKTATCNVTVNAFAPTAGVYNIVPNNALWGTNYNGTISSVAANKLTLTGSKYGISFELKNGSSTNGYIKDDQTRCYNGYTLKLSAPSGFEFTNIVITEGDKASDPTASVGSYNAETNTWTGNSPDVTFTYSGTSAITNLAVTYAAGKTLTGISITGTATALWKGDTFSHDGITVMASWSEGDPTDVTADCTFSGYEANTIGEQTITVNYKGQQTTYTVNVKTIANTQAEAYTVAKAKEIIDANKDLTTKVYVKGTVSQIDSYNSEFGSITYWISADGTTTNQFEVYGGLALGSEAKFSAKTDLTVGDDVIVYGVIKKWGSAYEFDKNNYLVKWDKVATFSIADITVAEGEDIIPVIETNIVGEYLIEYESDNEEVVLADDDELATNGQGSATITATIVADGYKTAETTFTVTVTTNATLESVAISGELENATYTYGDAFSKAGLTATAHYSDGENVDVTSTATWTFNGESALTLTTSGDVNVVATFEGTASAAKVCAVTVNKKASSIAIENIELEATRTATIVATTTPADAELTYTIEEGDAYITIEEGVITGVAEGTATVRADYAGTAEYEAASKKFTVNVVAFVPSVTWVAADWATANNITSNTNLTGDYETIAVDENIEMTWAKEETGSNVPAYNATNGEARVYRYGSVTFTAKNGVILKSIEFDLANVGSDVASNVGTYDATTKTWTGFDSQVKITNTGTANVQFQVKSVTIKYAQGTTTTLSISDISLKTTDEPQTIVYESNKVNPVIVYSNYNEAVITIAEGKVTPVTEGNTTVTATIAQEGTYTAATTTFTVTVANKTATTLSFPEAAYSVKANETFTAPTLTTTPADLTGVKYTSSNTAAAEVDENTGAVTVKAEGKTTIRATFAGTADYEASEASYELTVVSPYTDVITRANIGVDGTSYSSWSKTFVTETKYAGFSNAPTQTEAQKSAFTLRGTNSNTYSGIISTKTMGYAENVTIKWSSASTNGRALKIYGTNSALTSVEELTKMTAIATATYNSENPTNVIDLSALADKYSYIGLYPATNNAMYFDEIDITWTPVTFLNVAVAEAAHGTVTVDKTSCLENAVVTITATPATEDYELTSLKVYKTGDETTEVTLSEENTFEMPAYDVTVSATFALKEIPELTGDRVAMVVAYSDKYYAISTNASGSYMSAVEVNVVNGKAMVTTETVKEEITWVYNTTADGYIFQTEAGKYLSGTNKTDLGLSSTKCEWQLNADGVYYRTVGTSDRAPYFNGTSDFRNYADVSASHAMMLLPIVVISADAVAIIGENAYATLAEAVAAVPADGTETTITMLADVELTAAQTIALGQNIVLDLNGKNITSTKTIISNKGKLVVTGTGNITVSGTTKTAYGISNSGGAALANRAYLTVGENVTITAPCTAVYTAYAYTTVNGTLANTQAETSSNLYSTLRQSNSSEVIVAATASVTGQVNAVYGNYGTIEVNSTNVGKIYADGSATQGLKIKKTTAIESLDVVGHAEFSDVEDYYVAAKAFSACTGTVKLLSDINGALALSAGKTVTLDLNGHKVVAETYPIKVEGTLTITGDGTVQSTGMGSSEQVQAAAYVLNNGKLTIESGNFVAGFEGEEGNPAVYVRDNAVVEIKGGDFVGGSKFLLNKLDAARETSTIEVTGGTFHGFNPADNGAEGEHTNFCAAGYTGVETSANVFKVLPIEPIRSNLTVGKMGTICYKYGLKEIEGATFYEPIAYDGTYITFEAVDEAVAGYGYMFVAEAEEITAKLGGEVTTAAAGAPNHMQGTLVDIELDDVIGEGSGRDYCGIKNGHWQFFGEHNTMTAGHAYIVLEGLKAEPQGQSQNRRRLVVSSADNTDVVTGLNFSDLDTEVATKVLRDGQLYIIREGKMYNVQGAVVK